MPDIQSIQFVAEGERLIWRGNGETLVVEPWGANSLRVRARIKSPIRDDEWALLPQPAASPTISITGSKATLTNGRLTARLVAREWIDPANGYETRCRISFLDADGRVLTEEAEAGSALRLQARRWEPRSGGAYRLTATFESQDGERLYGMGQYQQTVLDLKGATLELAHRNSQASVPFVLSSRGYGILWHNPAFGRATFATNRSEWVADATEQLDYWITAGPTPADITRAYADATGHAPVMPERGLGFWQCKLRYSNQEELLAVAREHRRRGLPLDVIVADYFHWPHMGDYRFEQEFWPDPRAMIEELESMGVELMVSVWPQVAVASENYPAFRRANALVRTERGLDPQMAFEGVSLFADVTATSGRQLLWDICRRNYFDLGVRTFWLDEAEPEWGAYEFDNYRYEAGPISQVANLYPQQFARAFWDGQRAAGQEDVVNLIRCAWAGSQRYGALVWSGDIHSTWEDFRRQIVAGLQMGIAGIPWFTTDIGGFHGGDPEDPAFRELLIRWFQFGAFCPIMRLHGYRSPSTEITTAAGEHRSPTGGPNELWSFGEEAYPILAEFVHLRERLRPYLREVMLEAHEDGQPVLRALFHGFPDDPAAWCVADQFLLGSDLLVAPVVEPGARRRSVYLPDGGDWIELRTGARFPGGGSVDVEAPLTSIPLFLRAPGRADLLGLLS